MKFLQQQTLPTQIEINKILHTWDTKSSPHSRASHQPSTSKLIQRESINSHV